MLSPAVVIDIGSFSTRAGFAGSSVPTAVFPTLVGTPKFNSDIPHAHSKESIVGDDAWKKRMLLDMRRPVHKGIFLEVNDAEAIWNHAFSLLSAAPEERPVLLAETATAPAAAREKITELLFEGADVLGLCCVKSSVLTLLSVGKTTGTVLNVGHENTQASSVYEGSEILATVKKGELSGCDLTSYLESLSPAPCSATADMNSAERVQVLKKSLFVSQAPLEEMKRSALGSAKPYTLPDGTELPCHERFMCPEILFTPKRIGHSFSSIQKLVHSSILHSPQELQQSLFANIVLYGGTTLIRGFAERIESEISSYPLGKKARVYQSEDGGDAAWHGGSIFSSLSSFEQATITREEFEEIGPRVINWKCF